MKIRVLGSMGTSCRGLYSSSLLVNDCFLIDAGTGAFRLSLDNIDAVGDVAITHSHLDHIAALCFLADNRIGGPCGHGIKVYCLSETARVLREYLLNDMIWPNFESIKIGDTSLISFNIIKPFDTFAIGGCRITPLAVEHTVPALGFCLHGNDENFMVFFDFWDADEATFSYLRNLEKFKRMIIEVSYEEGAEKLAQSAGHLTPLLLEQRLEKMPPDIEVFYCHIKPRDEARIHEQMKKRFGNKTKPLLKNMTFDF